MLGRAHTSLPLEMVTPRGDGTLTWAALALNPSEMSSKGVAKLPRLLSPGFLRCNALFDCPDSFRVVGQLQPQLGRGTGAAMIAQPSNFLENLVAQ